MSYPWFSWLHYLSFQMKPCYITPDQISKELQDIENKLYDLENEGVELERRIRIYEEGLRLDVTTVNVIAAVEV